MAAWTARGEHRDKMTKGAAVYVPGDGLHGIVTEVDGEMRRVSVPSHGLSFWISAHRLCWVYEEMGG